MIKSIRYMPSGCTLHEYYKSLCLCLSWVRVLALCLCFPVSVLYMHHCFCTVCFALQTRYISCLSLLTFVHLVYLQFFLFPCKMTKNRCYTSKQLHSFTPKSHSVQPHWICIMWNCVPHVRNIWNVFHKCFCPNRGIKPVVTLNIKNIRDSCRTWIIICFTECKLQFKYPCVLVYKLCMNERSGCLCVAARGVFPCTAFWAHLRYDGVRRSSALFKVEQTEHTEYTDYTKVANNTFRLNTHAQS